MSTGMASDVEAIEAANLDLYRAFENGDLDLLGGIWDYGEDVVCVHPGWPVVRGRSAVLRSWALIMANTSYIQFFLTDVVTVVDGDVATLTCTENILTAVDDATGDATVCASNVYRRRPDGWRLWLHHGSPVMANADPIEDPTDPTEEPPGGWPGPDERAGEP